MFISNKEFKRLFYSSVSSFNPDSAIRFVEKLRQQGDIGIIYGELHQVHVDGISCDRTINLIRLEDCNLNLITSRELSSVELLEIAPRIPVFDGPEGTDLEHL